MHAVVRSTRPAGAATLLAVGGLAGAGLLFWAPATLTGTVLVAVLAVLSGVQGLAST